MHRLGLLAWGISNQHDGLPSCRRHSRDPVRAVRARVGWAHDVNLLRVPDDAPAFDDPRSDSWATFEVGAVYDKSMRRQRMLAVAKVSKVKFDHFRQLDYDGQDVQGTWHWQLGNQFSGKLGAVLARFPRTLLGPFAGADDPRLFHLAGALPARRSLPHLAQRTLAGCRTGASSPGSTACSRDTTGT